MYTEFIMKIWTCDKFVQSLLPGCSVTNRRRDALVTAMRWFMVIKTVITLSNLAPCVFSFFLKLKKNLRGSLLENIKKTKEAGVLQVH